MKHRILIDLKACDEAVNWASQFKTLKAAWMACDRPDWLLWYIGRRTKDMKSIVFFAKECATRAAAAAEEAWAAAAAARAAAWAAERKRQCNELRRLFPWKSL